MEWMGCVGWVEELRSLEDFVTQSPRNAQSHTKMDSVSTEEFRDAESVTQSPHDAQTYNQLLHPPHLTKKKQSSDDHKALVFYIALHSVTKIWCQRQCYCYNRCHGCGELHMQYTSGIKMGSLILQTKLASLLCEVYNFFESKPLNLV